MDRFAFRASMILVLCSMNGCYDYGGGAEALDCFKTYRTLGPDEVTDTHDTPWSYLAPYDGKQVVTDDWGALGWTLDVDKEGIEATYQTFRRRCDADPSLWVSSPVQVVEIPGSSGMIELSDAPGPGSLWIGIGVFGTPLEDALRGVVEEHRDEEMNELLEFWVELSNGLGNFHLGYDSYHPQNDLPIRVDGREIPGLRFNYDFE